MALFCDLSVFTCVTTPAIRLPEREKKKSMICCEQKAVVEDTSFFHEPEECFPSEGFEEEMKPISIIHKPEKKENAFKHI